ncbi:MAG: glycosyltransferase family 39 protein [Armatimonadetes bacterium]|nr:glycosyltransferase family 39 protein [Armatimonadota bacterium]
MERTVPRHLTPAMATLGVFLIAAVVMGFRLGAADLMDPDEGRYAAVAQEMWLSRDFVTPRFNGFVYLDKPPLLHWVTALSIGLLGPSEFAVRLGSMLAAAACLALVFAVGRRALGTWGGVAGALVLGSCAMWFVMGRIIRYDSFLALGVAAATLWGFLGAEAGAKGRRYYLAAAGALAVGILAKGPIGLALPGITLLVYFVVTGQARALLRIPWLPCLGLVAALTVPWFVAEEMAQPGATRFLLLYQNVGRLAGAMGDHHLQPWWYMLASLVAACLPWSLLLPRALVQARFETSPEAAQRRRLSTLCLIWTAVTVAVFSMAKAKLEVYVLPALPAVALLIAALLTGPRRGRGWEYLVTGLLLCAGGVAVWVLGPAAAAKGGVPVQPAVTLLAIPLLGGGLAGIVLSLLNRPKAALVALSLAGVLMYHAATSIVGSAAHAPSDRPISRLAESIRQPGERIMSSPDISRSTVFYLRERIPVIGPTPRDYYFPGNTPYLRGWVVPYSEARALLAQEPVLVICHWREVPDLERWAGDVIERVAETPGDVLFRSVGGRHP